MMSKVNNDLDKTGHSQNAEQKKRKRKRTPHGKKADKVDNVSMQHEESDSPTMIFDSVAEGFPPSKEKKAEEPEESKHRKNLEGITLDAAPKKQQKQKRAIESNIQTDVASSINPVHDSPPKEKRKHKEKTGTTVPAENSPETNVIPEKSEQSLKRKRKLSEASPEEAEAEVGTADKTESSERKKKKKKKKYSELESAKVSAVETCTLKRKKKKRPKTDDFPNPNGDSNLSEAALKALEYVHANVSSTPDWKFSKARQNWIIRNVWDDVIVPDLYFPSCLEYLSDVQGNTRSVLIKSSKDIIEKTSTQTTPADKETLSPVKSISKVRFQDNDELKEAKGLEDSGSRDTLAATTDTKGDGTSEGLISPGKLERARRLLERLEVKTT